jgi:hypothetical protein
VGGNSNPSASKVGGEDIVRTSRESLELEVRVTSYRT